MNGWTALRSVGQAGHDQKKTLRRFPGPHLTSEVLVVSRGILNVPVVGVRNTQYAIPGICGAVRMD